MKKILIYLVPLFMLHDTHATRLPPEDCPHLRKLWEKDEPLRREGAPESTSRILGNVAYREQPKGLSAFVKDPQKHHYEILNRLKGLNAGAFREGVSFPQVGASLPQWSASSTNKPAQSRNTSLQFLPHQASWVDRVRSEQDEL